MNLLQKRASIGAIESTPKKDRSSTACQRATDLNADMIVYGTLDASANPALLRLQFCVLNTTRDRDMGNLQELQKVDRLGGPLSVVLPLSDVQSSVNPPLRVRTALLAKLVVGLRYELAANPNFRFSLNKALGVFTDALDYLEKEGGATRDNGGDVVQFFIGRENFLLFQDSATPEEKKPGHLDAARDALARAVELNPRYARAYNALGNVYFRQAQQIPPEQRRGIPQLRQALDTYSAAIPLAHAAEDRSAEAEARLSLALTYRLRAEAALFQTPSDIAATEDDLRRADQEASAGEALIQPEQNRFRGFVAMVHGIVAHDRAQTRLRAKDPAAARELFQQARDFYSQCIAAGKVDPGDQFLKRQIIMFTCTPREASVAAALQRIQQ
jgi:tetratricopeptide (TPR) repeat protein